MSEHIATPGTEYIIQINDDQTLTGLQWPVERPRAVIVLAHGINEHVGRYQHVAAALNAAGYSVFGVDHRGHGRSAPIRKRTSNIRRFDDFVDDYIAVINELRSTHNQPLVALGHSMGGLIAARAAFRAKNELAALVLSGPALKLPTTLGPLQIKLSLLLARIAPFLNVPTGGIDRLSRDPSVRQRLTEDPYWIPDPVKLGIVRQIYLLAEETRSRAGELTVPLLVMHGAADQITLPAGSAKFVANAKSPDKELVSWPEDQHEIFNELDQVAVLARLIEWLDDRFPTPA